MKTVKRCDQQHNSWEAMDLVLGETPVTPAPPENEQPEELDDIQPILDRIEKREMKWTRVARAAA
jgi:hypothetical protein